MSTCIDCGCPDATVLSWSTADDAAFRRGVEAALVVLRERAHRYRERVAELRASPSPPGRLGRPSFAAFDETACELYTDNADELDDTIEDIVSKLLGEEAGR